MAAERDIQGWFLTLQGAIQKLVRVDLSEVQGREQAEIAAVASLSIAQSVVLDLHRIADAVECFDEVHSRQFERGRHAPQQK